MSSNRDADPAASAAERARILEAQLLRYADDLHRAVSAEREARRMVRELQERLARLNQQSASTTPPLVTACELIPAARPLASRMIGNSPALRELRRLCAEVAHADVSVLLRGDTGTGKELAASTIHNLSPRRDEPFVAVNCAALPPSLIESELFGHEKGSFTGADRRHTGHFESAAGGTLFLDEIGELPIDMQAKLLRVLEERSFRRIGATRDCTFAARVIAATNRDLKAEIAGGRFRQDLFYRLSVFPIHLPSLRSRITDLPLLVEHFARLYAARNHVDAPRFSPETLAAMQAYPWPGNIRELRNVVERCAVLAEGGVVMPRHLPPDFTDRGPTIHVPDSLASLEKSAIEKALREARWNKAAAARALGISWDNLRYRIKKYGIRRPVHESAHLFGTTGHA